MIVGVAGLFFGGWLGDLFSGRGYRDSKIRVGLAAIFVWLPFGVLLPFAPSGIFALALPRFRKVMEYRTRWLEGVGVLRDRRTGIRSRPSEALTKEESCERE